jgi:hypothetical protein
MSPVWPPATVDGGYKERKTQEGASRRPYRDDAKQNARVDAKQKRPGRCKTETPGLRMLPGVFVSGHKQECLCCLLVDVVLLPVEGGVGLDDYVFVCGLL